MTWFFTPGGFGALLLRLPFLTPTLLFSRAWDWLSGVLDCTPVRQRTRKRRKFNGISAERKNQQMSVDNKGKFIDSLFLAENRREAHHNGSQSCFDMRIRIIDEFRKTRQNTRHNYLFTSVSRKILTEVYEEKETQQKSVEAKQLERNALKSRWQSSGIINKKAHQLVGQCKTVCHTS